MADVKISDLPAALAAVLTMQFETNDSGTSRSVLLSQIAALIFANAGLTGAPTAPTATLGTNSNQIATMAAIKNAIDALVGAAPGALDTLSELADALNDDASFAATITAALAAKANATTFASITSAASPYAAVAWRTIQCTSGTITVNLPASPSANDEVVVIRDGAGVVTVGRNTKTISGASADFVLDVDKRSATFKYSGTTWIVAGGKIA